MALDSSVISYEDEGSHTNTIEPGSPGDVGKGAMYDILPSLIMA
jgi:hypothetical protein